MHTFFVCWRTSPEFLFCSNRPFYCWNKRQILCLKVRSGIFRSGHFCNIWSFISQCIPAAVNKLSTRRKKSYFYDTLLIVKKEDDQVNLDEKTSWHAWEFRIFLISIQALLSRNIQRKALSKVARYCVTKSTRIWREPTLDTGRTTAPRQYLKFRMELETLELWGGSAT